MMTDPIADMLTRIRNAVRVERPYVAMPLSKVKRGVAEVLKREGYIWDWREEAEEGVPSKQLYLDLKYGPNGERVGSLFTPPDNFSVRCPSFSATI